MKTLKYGSRGHFVETFTNLLTGLPADPSEAILKLRSPAGVESSYSLTGGDVVRDSAGIYHCDPPVPFTLAGEWVARWVTSGTLVATDEFRFRVEATAFVSP